MAYPEHAALEQDPFKGIPSSLIPFADSLLETERYYKQQEPTNIRVGVFAEAARRALREPYFADLVTEMYAFRPDLDHQYAGMLLLRGYQADLLEHDDTYPLEYDQVDAWMHAFEAVEDDFLRWALVRNNICGQQVQSNIAERYKSVKLLSALMRERFGERPSHLDIGSSLMHGGIKLAYSHVESDPYTQFGEIQLSQPTREVGQFQPDERLTTLANRAIKQHVEYGSLVGVDITDVNDPVIQKWAMSCSFKPDELMDEHRKREFTHLDSLDKAHNRIEFFRGDFSNFDNRTFRQTSPVKEFDIITFSTVLYQLSATERHAMVVNALNYLNNDGILLIQDTPDGNYSKKFNYYTEVIDATNIDAGPQQILRWENSRCRKAVAGLGKFSINGVFYTLAEGLAQTQSTVVRPDDRRPTERRSS